MFIASGVSRLSRLSARAVRGVASTSFRLAKVHYKAGLPDPVKTNPVIVYTVGKVGSLSVAATLEKALENRVVAHVHYLTTENLRADEGRYRDRARAYRGTRRMRRFMPRYVWLGEHLSNAIASAPATMVWDVVTLVRDPVRRNMSSFFQDLELVFDFWPAEELKYRSAEDVAARLVEMFVDSYVWGNLQSQNDDDPLTWFDHELKPVFGVDVFEAPFPVPTGYKIYEGANSRVLLLRLEDLDRVANSAFAAFLGTIVREVVHRNDAQDKVYADVYHRFRKLLRMPTEYLDRMYSSRYSRHFYTPAELAGFRARWQ
jgi:hypothetical protein